MIYEVRPKFRGFDITNEKGTVYALSGNLFFRTITLTESDDAVVAKAKAVGWWPGGKYIINTGSGNYVYESQWLNTRFLCEETDDLIQSYGTQDLYINSSTRVSAVNHVGFNKYKLVIEDEYDSIGLLVASLLFFRSNMSSG